MIHLYQDKIVRLSDAENVERGGMYALEMKFGGGNSTEQKEKSLIIEPQQLVLRMLHHGRVQFSRVSGLVLLENVIAESY